MLVEEFGEKLVSRLIGSVCVGEGEEGRYLWWGTGTCGGGGETEELWGRRADTLGGGQVVGRREDTG